MKQSAACKTMQKKIGRRFLNVQVPQVPQVPQLLLINMIIVMHIMQVEELANIKANEKVKVKKESVQEKWYKNIF